VKVVQYIRVELALSVTATTAAFVLQQQAVTPTALLPFSIAAILGSALAIFLAFRNNSSYARWWEARTLWAGIVNASRVLARLIITFTDSHAHQANYDKARSEHFKRVMVYRCIAWAHALRLHLRGQDSWDELQPFISEQEFQALLRVHNKPNYLHLLMGSHLYKAMADGTLGGFDSFQMEGQLLALANYQGSCERIKTTPLLRQYDYFTRLFLYVFIIVLPFALLGDFTKMGVSVMMIPTSLTIAFVFAVMGKVGEVNEDPFENRITDVPLTALCDTIERDLKELLGEHHALRQPIQAHNGYLL
jgi:putative membrane protein